MQSDCHYHMMTATYSWWCQWRWSHWCCGPNCIRKHICSQWKGKDGSKIQPFPYRAHGRIMSPVLLLDMSKRGEKPQGLTLATTSFDGYLYLIEGSSGCADVVDIGETSYAISSLLCEILVAFLGTVLTSIKCAHFFALWLTGTPWFWLTMWMVETILILLLLLWTATSLAFPLPHHTIHSR